MGNLTLRNTAKWTGMAILFAVLVTGFQNCGSPISLMKTGGDYAQNASGGGNGEGYGGMAGRAGLYYRIQKGFNCSGTTTTSLGISSTILIEVNSAAVTATQTDGCTGMTQNLDVTTLKLPTDNVRVLTMNGAVFERYDTPPDLTDINLKVAFAHCQTTAPFQGPVGTLPQERDLTLYRTGANQAFIGGTLLSTSVDGSHRVTATLSQEAGFSSTAEIATYQALSWTLRAIFVDPPSNRRATLVSKIDGQAGVFEFPVSCVFDGD